MSETSSNGLDAQKLRMLLIGTLLVILLAGIGGFVFARQQIMTYAVDVSKATNNQKISSDNLNALQAVQTTLSNNKDAVSRTSELVAESKEYQYQDQIIADVNTYAQKAGISITGYTFTSDVSASASASGTTSGTAAAANGTAGNKAISGLKTVGVTVAIKSPVPYGNVMNFIHYLELNLTKMQLKGVSLSNDTADRGNVTVGALNLEVYTR